VRPLRVGIIGCGRAACNLHLPALGRIGEAEAVALADPSPEALNRAGERFAVARRSSDYRELLADESIEAVCVTAPTYLHTEVALAALDAGKHVLVEKPLALSLDDCDLLVERAAESGVKTMLGFNLRWHRQARRARELARRGDLGKLSLLRTAFVSPTMLSDLPPWRADPTRGGGLLAMQSVHHLDLWRFLLAEEIEEVFCMASSHAGDAGPGTAVITASTTSGIGVVGAFSAITGRENEFAIHGSDAWLRASFVRFDSLELMPREMGAGDFRWRARRPARSLAEFARAAPALRQGGDYVLSIQREWRQFVDAIRRDGPIECRFEDGREATRILLAVIESAETGAAVRVANAPRAMEAPSDEPYKTTYAQP
jgi:myo-inositol 2-dehydrogenase / D-chiro-inositol 1-dehydrogenase